MPSPTVHKIVRALVLVMLVFAALFDAPAERLPIKSYTTSDGLPRDHISRIRQDSRGFLWFCTSEGLSRFDGYKFTNYGTEQGLAARAVNDFLETRDGTYWAATDKGLCRFIAEPLTRESSRGSRQTSQRFIVYHPSEDLAAQVVDVIYEDREGVLWCGTDAGLFRLDQINGEWVFTFVNILSQDDPHNGLFPRSILEDRTGSLWIAAEFGLFRRRPDGIVERYATEEGMPASGIGRALLEDRDGRIWVGTPYGLYRLVAHPNPHRSVVERIYTIKDGLLDNVITSLCLSSDGKLWVGTASGISEFGTEGEGRFQNYTQSNGLTYAKLTALVEDHDHNLWIGTDSGGAMRLATNGFTTYTLADGLGGVSIGTIFEDRDGRLIVGDSEGHLNRLDGRRFTPARLTLPKDMTYRGWGWNQVMFQDSRREWWMNTGEGLVRYPVLSRLEQITNARPEAIYTKRDGLPDNDVFRLFEDSRGDIWISTLGNPHEALTRWDRATETFHRYTAADGVLENAPTAFCEDASGNLWIGFYTGGLVRYSQGRFTSFTSDDGVPPGFVRGIHLDHNGRLWSATAEGGVARTDDPNADHPSFVTYSTANGLSSNQANCVTDDQWGMIYIGTGRGVDKLDPANGHIRHFTTADGLANSFVNIGFRHHDGSLWFGTLQGLSRFIPQPEQPAQPPPVLISSLSIAGVPYQISELGASEIDGPELGASQNNIQIDFVGLSLGVGETLRYQFKLEGGNDDWTTPGDQRNVNYPNLPPGTYRFLVRAVSSEGSFSQAPAMVSFRILTPLWQRWWFVLITLVLVAIPIVAVARYRHQRMKVVRDAEAALRRIREERLVELEQMRRRIATDLHDDIGSSLSQIYLLSEVVRQRVGRDDMEVIEPLSMISSASEEMVGSMSDIVWAINPQKDHLSDVTHRMRRFASDSFSTRDIRFRFRAPEAAAVDPRLGANIRREVFLIFKESVNNLVKHSCCTEAEIEFQVTDSWLLLTVSDNGKGFDPSKDVDGHGLMSMRERASSIGGEFDLVSGEGGGTTITLRVRLVQPASSPGSNGSGSDKPV